MKCINRCPEKAIQTTHGLAVAFWLIVSSIFGEMFPDIGTTVLLPIM